MKFSFSTTAAIFFFVVLPFASLVAALPKTDLISREEEFDTVNVPKRRGVVTCNPGRHNYASPAPETKSTENYWQVWRHGGDWKAEPNKTVLVNCRGGAGIWFLNTTPNEMTVQYARIGSMARDVVLMCTSRIRRKSFVVNGESASDIGFVVIVAGAPCPPGLTLEYEQVRP